MTAKPWRYLRDRDVQVAAAVTVLVLLLSAGLVWLGYVIHVWRIAARSPLVPSRRMIVLVFGRHLVRDAPGPDYQQRLARALALVEQGHANHLLLLGGRSGGQQSEAAAGAQWLRQQGLRGEVQLELEQDSVDSLENLRHARQLLQADASLPPVVLLTSRYHLARCCMLARRLGFEGLPIAAEPTLPLRPRYLARLLTEASYLMWLDLGLRWAALVGNTRMTARIS
ncbi:YdcF family protein [Rhodanobacter sp. AS-Z3]|uniref:YdcF family protein n=1 Tax=Rhodanobacter sp. AS-Z3 TaxID=3031330 RepID=UPI0024792152|nr:YdcF family protein [Rhodanobacter sp. AS-Z3]WEN15330.1 YdcF family protein [Rhodanobacter sp. AS-Z3]